MLRVLLVTDRPKPIGAGVSTYLVEGLAAQRLAPILEVALAHFARENALRLSDAETELADRKTIDRAKRLLMERREMSEHDAYAALRRHAMDQGLRLSQAGYRIISMLELLG